MFSYKDSLKNGIEIVNNHLDTIIWIKLDHNFFNLENDIYVCGTYLWGEDSPAYNIANVDLFEILENDIDYYEGLGSVYVMGDLNSRVGTKHDFIIQDSVNFCTDDSDYIPDEPLHRASLDRKCNNQGIKMLDLCKSTFLRIGNGRIGSNTDVCSFVSQNGES